MMGFDAKGHQNDQSVYVSLIKLNQGVGSLSHSPFLSCFEELKNPKMIHLLKLIFECLIVYFLFILRHLTQFSI